jgi:hypothetical protein
MSKKTGPYESYRTSSTDALWGIKEPGTGRGYYAWLLYPQNTFSTVEEADKAARLMNIAYKEGQRSRSREIKYLLED